MVGNRHLFATSLKSERKIRLPSGIYGIFFLSGWISKEKKIKVVIYKLLLIFINPNIISKGSKVQIHKLVIPILFSE